MNAVGTDRTDGTDGTDRIGAGFVSGAREGVSERRKRVD